MFGGAGRSPSPAHCYATVARLFRGGDGDGKLSDFYGLLNARRLSAELPTADRRRFFDHCPCVTYITLNF